ncbi:MAG: type I secretion system permease/ATPase, partial [Hyphomicrobium sp.]|nr:type I secretion system permease/ATPase [Hyphomicrobium sp.]
PNSNLDTQGDNALTAAIRSVRDRGGIVVVVAHRPSALAGLDKVLALGNGQVQAFGPRDEVLKAVLQSVPGGPAPTVTPAVPTPAVAAPAIPAAAAIRALTSNFKVVTENVTAV